MSFQDQMIKDLEQVFFTDFAAVATVAGVEVKGNFDRISSSFDAMSGSSLIFAYPSYLQPAVKKNDLVVRVSDGKSFKVRDIDRENNITRLYL